MLLDWLITALASVFGTLVWFDRQGSAHRVNQRDSRQGTLGPAMDGGAVQNQPGGLQRHRATVDRCLRKAWGAAYDANLAAANAEARRVFDALPASVTVGADFKDWCAASGLGNSRVLVEQCYRRAKARTKGAKR